MARRKISGEAEAAVLLEEWRSESVDFKGVLQGTRGGWPFPAVLAD